MKTIKLGAIAAVLLCIFFACTKTTNDLKTQTTDESLTTAAGRGGGGSNNSEDAGLALEVLFNPDPATVNESVTVTGTFAGRSAVPDCGKLHLFQKINGDWVKVADAELSASVHAVNYSFTPTVAGEDVYEFRVHYIKAGGCDYDNAFSDSYFLDVNTQCVSVFTITPSLTAQNVGGGLYEFTVSYTLTSPVDVADVKFQGGATAGGNVGHVITNYGNTSVANANNNNTVLKWEGSLTACTPQTINFKFTRNFSCPAAAELITGSWSASSGTNILGSISSLPYTCQ
jgi:hypothetical protein